jgi:hypothetical protein
MIAAGRIDNSISSVGFGLQKRRVVERPNDRLDVVGRNRAGLRLVTNQAANLMTRCDKGCCNCAAAHSWSADEAIAAWGRNMAVFSLGSNSRVRGKAAADLGWSPTQRSVTRWIANELV